jgi:DNA-binding NarL/FixJ family response regulator
MARWFDRITAAGDHPGAAGVTAAGRIPSGEVLMLLSPSPPPRRSGSVPVRVVLADDHPIVREPLRWWLEEHEPDIVVVGEAGDGLEAIGLTEELRPDVLLLDVDMPDADGVRVTEAVRAAGLPTKIVVLTGHADGHQARALARLGVEGYLLKTSTFPQIVAALRLVQAGHRCLPAALTEPAAPAAADRSGPTAREAEVLRLVAGGSRTRAIAADMGVSERTVRFHLSRLFQKLGAASRTQAVAAARERAWLG